MPRSKRLLLFTLLVVPAYAQFGRGDGVWNTSGGDAQRTSWVRTDGKISRTSMQAPGFATTWKVKLNNDPRQLNSLTEVALLDRYIGYRGFRSLGFLTGSGDRIFALDTDLGRVEWQKRLTTATPQGGSLECPGGMTAAVTRPVTTAVAAMPGGGRGGAPGRSNAAKSAVGEPDHGAVIIDEVAARAAAAANAAGRGPGRGAPAPGGPPRRLPNYIHAVSSDGMFHSLWVSNGDEPDPPVPFLPAGANVHGLILVNNIAYASTGQGCGTAPNAVWALDLESKQVTSWKPEAADIAGTDGIAFGPDGTLYVATTQGGLAALDPKTLAAKGSYSGKAGFTSSPVIFPYKDKTLVAAATQGGAIQLLDSNPSLVASGTGTDERSSSPVGLATWQDPAGTRWLLEPVAGAVVAWKIVDRDGALSLERGWTSRELVSPLTPMIVNGVVFAVSSGEYRSADPKLTAAQRAQKSVPAVLYALDAVSGKELWNSGAAMTSFVHSGGLSAGSGQLYLGAYDGTLYSFGFPIEH